MNYLTLFFLFVCANLSAQVQLEQGLEAWITFGSGADCHLQDSTGNPGVQLNATQPDIECACGVEGNSLFFDGSGNFLFFFGDDVEKSFTTIDFSLSFYFKPITNDAQSMALFAKRKECGQDSSFSIRYVPKTRVLSVELNENSVLSGSISKVLSYSCWYHIVVVRKGGTTSLYVNGQLSGSVNSAGSQRVSLESSEVLTIGHSDCDLDVDFRGFMDEIRLYSRALRIEEVEALYLYPDQIANGNSLIGVNDTTIFLGTSMQAYITNSCATDFMWSPTDGVSEPNIPNPVLTPTTTTTYALMFADTLLCNIADSLRITVVDPATIDCNDIMLPSVFTPNNDGLNDAFGISNPFVAGEILAFEIYDRWGSIVYSTTDPLSKWDASFKGQPVNPGVFLYKIRYRCKGEEGLKTGSVTVIR
jgi:gliding motility-associated-like protein